jgi:hypothetical protein
MTTLIYLQIPVPEPIPGDPVPVPDPIPRPQPMPDPPLICSVLTPQLSCVTQSAPCWLCADTNARTLLRAF